MNADLHDVVYGVLVDSAFSISNHYAYAQNRNVDKKPIGVNASGDMMTELDRLGSQIVIERALENDNIATIIDEETHDPITRDNNGKWRLYVDPVDGSSQIKYGLPIGMMFGIVEEKEMPCGNDYHIAGMINIPSMHMLLAIKGKGVFFQDLRDYRSDPFRVHFGSLNNPEISVNASNLRRFMPPVTEWLERKLPDYTFRYAGALVVDFWRIFFGGGMFAYPSITRHENPEKNRPNGKLRLGYEGAVVDMICREGGGKAVNHAGHPISSISIETPHQRTGLFVGDIELVDDIACILKTVSSE